MTAHPDGTGTGWDEDAPDVDQPHGLDYRALQHIMKGVRKRVEHEHSTFADATVGGIHVPGGCQIMEYDDTGAVDAIIDSTGLGVEHGLMCSTHYLWRFEDSTTPQVIASLYTDLTSSDVTITGARQFDGTVDFLDEVDVSTLIVDASADFGGAAEFKGEVDFSVTVHTGDISMGGNKVVDATTPTANDDVANKKYVDDLVGSSYHLISVNGTPTKVYTKYLTGSLDADAATSVAHNITNGITKILSVTASAYEDGNSVFGVADYRLGGTAASSAFRMCWDGTNVFFGDVGTHCQGNAYVIRIDYIL